jgi:hypothetical protein
LQVNFLRLIRYLFLLFLLSPLVSAFGQKQLVVVKRENVLLRLSEGDAFTYKPKGSTRVHETYVRQLTEIAVITHRDTVPFHMIDRIYFRQRKFYNTIGSALVIFGGGLFIIDQFNEVIVNGREPGLDDNVSRLSAGALALGIPMMLIKKKSQRIRHPVRLMTVDRRSIFYTPDRRQRIE